MGINAWVARRRRATLIGAAPFFTAAMLASPLAAHADTGQATISGTVQYHGTPVAGVAVWLATDSSLSYLGESATNGTFSADATVDPASHYWIAAGEQRNRFSSAARKYVLGFVGQAGTTSQAQPYRDLVQPIAGSALAGEVSNVTIEAIRPGTIAGTLAGVASRSIDLSNLGGDRITGAHVGKAGKFSFRDLTPGKYRLSIEPKDGYADQLFALTNDVVTVTSGTTTHYTGKIASGTRIQGRVVVNGSGSKGHGIHVHVVDSLSGNVQVVAAGADGSFKTRQLPTGTYSLAADASSGLDDTDALVGSSVSASISGSATPKPITIRMHRQGDATLTGSITRSGSSQGYGEVVVERSDHSVVRDQPLTLRGSSTSYRVPGLPAGTYTVVIATTRGGGGFSHFTSKKVTLRSGHTSSAGSVAPRTKALSLKLKATPTPAQGDYFGVNVDPVGNGGPGAFGTFSANGTWTVNGLLPAKYQISADYGPGDSNDRAALNLQTITLTSSKSATVDLSKASGSVSFEVKYPFDYGDDVCLSTYTTITSSLGETISAYSPQGGSFTLKYLRPGHYSWSSMTNCTSEPMWLRAAGGFTVVAGQATDLGTISLLSNYG